MILEQQPSKGDGSGFKSYSIDIDCITKKRLRTRESTQGQLASQLQLWNCEILPCPGQSEEADMLHCNTAKHYVSSYVPDCFGGRHEHDVKSAALQLSQSCAWLHNVRLLTPAAR